MGGPFWRAGGQTGRYTHTVFVGQFQEPPDSPMRLRDAPTPPRAQPSQLTTARFFSDADYIKRSYTRDLISLALSCHMPWGAQVA